MNKLEQVAFIISITITMGFGIDQKTWPNEASLWPSEAPFTKILYENSLGAPFKLTLEEAIKKSNDFPVEFPINSTRWAQLGDKVDRAILEKDINLAYPLIHEQAFYLFVSFLNQKRRFGSSFERNLYQNMSLVQLIDRLLTTRAVAFVGVEDEYLLLDGSKGKGEWEEIVTDHLSYDEIKLSALLSVSSPSVFIGSNGSITGTGVVIGTVGPRLEKKLVMEYREIMKTKEQNNHINGYGQFFVPTMQGIFTNFYGDVSATYEQLQMGKAFEEEDRYIKIDNDKFFDKWVYKRRISLSIDTLLVEANNRARLQNKKAHLHVVGFGLKQWKITAEQDEIFLETFLERITFLKATLDNLEEVCFFQIDNSVVNKIGDIQVHSCDRLIPENPEDDTIVVTSYNWNGNALPGNEFWLHNLTASDASVMAKSTQIAEIQNPYINTNIRASNLRVVTLQGLLTFKDYLDLHKHDKQ